jgi:hypothetical protein
MMRRTAVRLARFEVFESGGSEDSVILGYCSVSIRKYVLCLMWLEVLSGNFIVDSAGITAYRPFTAVISVDIKHGVMRRKITSRWILTAKLLFDRRREFNMATYMVLQVITKSIW